MTTKKAPGGLTVRRRARRARLSAFGAKRACMGLSQWLYSVLAEAGLPVICVETRHMRAMLKAQINKTDRNEIDP
jgi:transposase